MIREDRYIVIKRNRLTADEEIAIREVMPARSCVNGVVVEHDWPEYEPVWAMIEARCTAIASMLHSEPVASMCEHQSQPGPCSVCEDQG